MSILICTSKHGGCGLIGHNTEFGSFGEDMVICPRCSEDHTCQLLAQNLQELTDNKNSELAHLLVTKSPLVVAIAKCGCTYHVEDREPCMHDIKLARERYWLQAVSQ